MSEHKVEDYIENQNKAHRLYPHEAKLTNNYLSSKWFTYFISPEVLNIINTLTIYLMETWVIFGCAEPQLVRVLFFLLYFFYFILFYFFCLSPLDIHTDPIGFMLLDYILEKVLL